VTFADVVGHEAAVRRLRRVCCHERVAAAYCISGPTGVGKRTLADAFAMELVCAGSTDGACGTCAQCIRVTAGTHPDVRVLVRDEDRRDMRTEQIRELTRWLTLRPLMAARKVAIVDGADTLNEHGQNALLKTLEEPPGASVLVLVATRVSLLLPTVRSRCQHVRLEPLSDAAMTRVLERQGIARDEAVLLIARAGGSPGRALALRAEEHPEQRIRLLERLGRLPELSAAEVSALAQTLARGEIEPALDVIVSWYRDLVGLAAGGASPVRNADVEPQLRATAGRSTLDVVLRQLEAVCDTLELIDQNANRVLALETLLLALRRIERGSQPDSEWTSVR
jgi:DNA polymerase III subunit delta'